MRAAYLFLGLAVAISAPLAAQSKAKKAPTSKTVSISGCVAERPGSNDLTMEDKSGSYRLTGLSLHDFVGQQVQLSGSVYESKKLVIKGGLRPSPNAAGQAGAIDQTQVANETVGGSGPTGDVQLPEFRVKSIRPLGTGCK
ncbi:MAG TPA: hypothetical protein VFB07_01630 [Vicinamibacterales bacterium]|nr:hypothetical protein [Vicinamibacterales bacterium]